jgi:hypothetical protein
LRERLGSIPHLIDDVSRAKFTTHVSDLVRTDQEMSATYAPIMLTTNRDAGSIPPDLTKGMVPFHTDAAIPENRSVTERSSFRMAERLWQYRSKKLFRILTALVARNAFLAHLDCTKRIL